ncbi:MAG: tRNA (adenosine(37)-N6)-dimethylallyltransferase MiaA [Oscillospiraceae bacterium]
MEDLKPKIICVVGPTASGKTSYAIKLAKECDGEIVSCDSMQIYKYMNIGTAKPTLEEMDGVVHHMINFVEPWVNYSVADFTTSARMHISDILARGKMPILCGGTGLYLDSTIKNIKFISEDTDVEYRKELTLFAMENGKESLHELLKDIDIVSYEKIHPNNVQRVIRALEVYKATGKPKSEIDILSRGEEIYDSEIFGLSLQREVLYDRINKRVDIMMDNGLVEEVKSILSMEVPKTATAMQAIGYKEIVRYLDGEYSLEKAVDAIKQESRHYAKRQITWFRRNEKIKWINVLGK